MTFPSVRIVIALVIGFASLATRGAEPAIIAKARAYVGSESALNNIQSIHHTGTLITNDPTDATKQTRATIDIILVKPDSQKVTITSDQYIETTALDGYDGWTRTTMLTDAKKWQQTLLGAEGIKRLRANTWENLSYYRGLEKEGGSVEDKGPATIDGITCQKIAFVHGPNIVFTRYFEVSTGRVVLTETETATIKEQGEMNVNGLRFPKTIVTTYKNPARVVTITFDETKLNESFPPSTFKVPGLGSR